MVSLCHRHFARTMYYDVVVHAAASSRDVRMIGQSLDLKELTVMHLLRWISTFGFLAVAIPAALVGQGSQTASREEARKVIQEGNIEWGKHG